MIMWQQDFGNLSNWYADIVAHSLKKISKYTVVWSLLLLLQGDISVSSDNTIKSDITLIQKVEKNIHNLLMDLKRGMPGR